MNMFKGKRKVYTHAMTFQTEEIMQRWLWICASSYIKPHNHLLPPLIKTQGTLWVTCTLMPFYWQFYFQMYVCPRYKEVFHISLSFSFRISLSHNLSCRGRPEMTHISLIWHNLELRTRESKFKLWFVCTTVNLCACVHVARERRGRVRHVCRKVEWRC